MHMSNAVHITCRIGLDANLAGQDLASVGRRLCYRSMRDGHERADERDAREGATDGDNRGRRLEKTYQGFP